MFMLLRRCIFAATGEKKGHSVDVIPLLLSSAYTIIFYVFRRRKTAVAVTYFRRCHFDHCPSTVGILPLSFRSYDYPRLKC